MNSVSRPFTVRVSHDSVDDHVRAFKTALDLFGAAELSEFLPLPEHVKYLDILTELVRLDLVHHWSSGAPIALETYQARYPELFASPAHAYQVTQEDYRLRREAGEVGPAISPLDPAVSSKFDIVLAPDDSANYPLTVQPSPSDDHDSSWPSAEIGQTRNGRGELDSPRASDPDIAWKLNEAMLEMPKVGDEFLGFSLLAELGKGAFGKVFLAQQGQLAHRLVALKVATGLFNESQTLAQLQHTHIVPIYSYHHGQPFQAVCMPFLGSTTLAHVLADIRTHKSMPSSGRELLSTLNGRKKSTRRFDEESGVREQESGKVNPESGDGSQVSAATAAQRTQLAAHHLEIEGMSYVDSILWMSIRLADGLAHAHAQGIIHQDLKPANILLTNDGQPMLLDFNLAQDNKARGSAAGASIGGTLPYMAPEHLEAFRGKANPVDARSDLYSLGVILFELLTGAAPFASYRKLPTREIINRMIEDRLQGAPRLRTLNPAVAPALEAIVLRCLQADPAQRYQTVRQLQDDLQCQLDNKPLVHAGNPSLLERVQKFRRRHPRLMSATTAVAVAAVLIAGMTAVFSIRDEQHRRLEAKETLTRFQDGAQHAYFLLNARSVHEQLDEGQHACRSTLGHFRVLDNPNWHKAPAVKRLSGEEQTRLHHEVGQLLVVLAHAQQLAGEREADAHKRQALFQEGLQLCSLASDCYDADQLPVSLLKQQGELHRLLDQLDRARDLFDRAGKADFRTAHDRYLAARLLAEEGKFRDALPLVREAIRMSPQDFNLHFLQGICHDYLVQNAQAAACYRTCIALRPSFFGAYHNRGLTALRQGDFKAALADFDDAIRLKPAFVESYAQRAIAQQGLKRYAEAIADLSEAIERGDAPTRYYFQRAKARELAGDRDGAKKDFAEGLRREPSDEQSWIARGIAFLPGEPKRALSDFDQALKLNPRSLAGLHNKAHVLGKYFKRTEEAVETLDVAIKLFPDDARPLAGRATYLARLGKRDAALKDAELALQIDTHDAANLYQLAGVYAQTSKQEPDDRHDAMRFLGASLRRGFGFDYLAIDRDLDPIRQTPAFQKLVEASKALPSAAPKR